MQSGLSRGAGFSAFASATPRSGMMVGAGMVPAPAWHADVTADAPGEARKPRPPPRQRGTARGTARQMTRPDPELQLAKDARDAILDLRTTLHSLKKEEQISWRKKSQLVRDRRFETNGSRRKWATSDVSEVLGEEALALGAKLAGQCDAMQTVGDDLRKAVRVHRKPPLPTFPRALRYTPEIKPIGQTERTQRVSTPGRGESASAGAVGGSFSDRPIPPMHIELDPRTAAILARVEPESLSSFSLPELGPALNPEPEPEPGPGQDTDPEYQRLKTLVWRIALGKENEGREEEEDPFATEVQGHFLPKKVSARPPEISRVEYFRQLDAKAGREKARAAQREEAERVAAVAAAKQAMIDAELLRWRKELAYSAAAAVVSAEVERIIRAAAEVEAAGPGTLRATEQAEVDPNVLSSSPEADVESQHAATRSAELLAAGGGDAGLRRRVAQRWLLKEFVRCTRIYR